MYFSYFINRLNKENKFIIIENLIKQNSISLYMFYVVCLLDKSPLF